MLWYAPTVNSFRRIAGGEFSGNGLSWGYDSRMVSCRVLVEEPSSTRLEWRVPGADVNPYLAIGRAARIDSRGHRERHRSRRAPRRRGLGARGATASRASRRGDGAFRDSDWDGRDVRRRLSSSHYAEAGRWEWERFLAADVVTEWERRRYFEVI